MTVAIPHNDPRGEGPMGFHVRGPRGYAFLTDPALAQKAIDALTILTGDKSDDYTVVPGRERPAPTPRTDVVLRTRAQVAQHLREAFPELSDRAHSTQTSWWIATMGARGRVLRVAHNGAIKRAATALRISGDAAGGFEVRFPMRASQLDALVFAELQVLAIEASPEARAQLQCILTRFSVAE